MGLSRHRVVALAASLALAAPTSGCGARAGDAPVAVTRLWAAGAPGTESWTGPEVQLDAELPNLGKVHIVTNVTAPSLTVVRPPAGKANGAAMLVVPGGAFRALAWDLDGTETARWLADRGFTAFILKYRVRPPGDTAPPGPESFDAFASRTRAARDIAVADARQALHVIRRDAARYGFARDRVGAIGFSAGAMTVVDLALAPDAKDRPDFVASLYGAMTDGGTPPPAAPPLFIAAAQDDPQVPSTKSTELYESWTRAGRPAELHLYEKGGHGFGFRTHHLPSDKWPDAFAAWLASRREADGK
jgi:acetyl esterase/lipase